MDEIRNLLREPHDLARIDWRSLLDDTRGAGADSLRVWVPSCGRGEEAYTVAILASEALGAYAGALDVLATDSSRAELDAASEGGYPAAALAEIPPIVRDRYFDSAGDRFVVRPAIREVVRFREHDLMSENLPPDGEGGFDVVSCRHVLDTSGPETVGAVIDRLEVALRPGGKLVLGPPDRLGGSFPDEKRPPVPGGERRRLPHRPSELPRHLRSPLGLPDPHRRGARPPSPVDTDAGPRSRLDDRIENALLALDADDPESALMILAPVLEADPLHSDAHFVRGVAQLVAGDAEGAVTSFRRAIYIDPAFSLALFELARAHEALGDLHGARQAYEDALRTFEAPRDRHEVVLDYVDLGEVQTACAERLRALGSSS